MESVVYYDVAEDKYVFKNGFPEGDVHDYSDVRLRGMTAKGES